MSHPSPYSNLPGDRFWKTGVAQVHPLTVDNLYVKKFEISSKDKIATAGSCFAQHIARYMRQKGFDVLDEEPPPRGMSEATKAKFGYELFSARYGNIYVCRQLLQLAKEVYRGEPDKDVVWSKNGRYFDAMRPGIEPDGLGSPEEVLEHRYRHLRRVRRMLRNMDVFVFTFGLTEAWINGETGRVYPVCPGTIAGDFDPELHHFKNFGYSEICRDFREFRQLVKKRNANAKFVLTVSPIPLTATASNHHVLVATTYSKSVLRSVAGDLASEFSDVDYFPSYEIIASPWSRGFFFEPNLRSVNSGAVEAVMRVFFKEHPGAGATNGHRQRRSKPGGREEEVCEEALLEGFS